MALINIKKCHQPHGSRHLSLLPYFQPIILSIAAIGVYDACDVGQAQGDKHQGEPPRPSASAALAVAVRGCLPLRLLLRHGGCRVSLLRGRRCPCRCCRLVSGARPTHAVEDTARTVGLGLYYAVRGHRPRDAVGTLRLFGLRLGAAIRARLRLCGCLRLRCLGHADVTLFMTAASDCDHKQQRYYDLSSHCRTYLVIAATCIFVSSALPASLNK